MGEDDWELVIAPNWRNCPKRACSGTNSTREPKACTGQKCSEFERCFITEMRRKAMESDIVIVNHHLFFADLAIKLQADGAPDAGILPEAGGSDFR